MKYLFFCALFIVLNLNLLQAQTTSPLGTWKSVDDKTGEIKSHVELFQKNGRMYGKVVKILANLPSTKCEDCTGEKKGQPIMGMVIIEDLQEQEGAWKSGTILDPQSGNVYACAMWLENDNPNELKVRGKHWTGLCRTQTWHRVK